MYKHPTRTGRVTIAGKPNDDLSPKTFDKYPQASRTEKLTTYRFLIVVEEAGSVATGATRQEAEKNMSEAIQLHIEGMKEDGLPIPQSSAVAEHVILGAQPAAAAGVGPLSGYGA